MDVVTILVIVVSLVLIYFLSSTLVSLILELWTHFREVRQGFLEKQLTERLGEDTAQSILSHPSISGASTKKPKSISSKAFGTAAAANLDKDSNQVLDCAMKSHGSSTSTTDPGTTEAPATTTPGTTENSPANTTSETDTTPTDPANTTADAPTYVPPATTENTPAADPVVPADTAGSSTTTPSSDQESALASWYDDFSSDMSSEYRSYLRIPSLIIAAIVVLLLNIDTLGIISYIWNDDSATKETVSNLVAISNDVLENYDPTSLDTIGTSDQVVMVLNILSSLDSMEDAGLPIGWKTGEELGLVQEAFTTTNTIQFEKVTTVTVDTTAGKNDTTISFTYMPPTGAAAFKSNAEIDKGDGINALFGTTIPNPNPSLSESSGALNLDLGGVFDEMNLDSLGVIFTGIQGTTYGFQAAAHSNEVPPSFFEVVGANLATIDLVKIIGWLISIIAIGMGSSFWYDILKNLTNIVSKTST